MRPTLGRIVHFKGHIALHEGPETFAAIVTKVWSPTCVDLAVFTSSRVAHVARAFPLSLDAEGNLIAEGWFWPPRED